jgi:2-methylcitrate dehydratase PrpD
MDAIVPLVRNLIKIRYEDIPPQVLAATKKSIVDTFAAMLAGTSAQGCPEVVAQALEWGGKKESTVFHYGKKVPAFLAALANGMMARAVDFDDVFEPGTMHASASIVPAVVAAAEMKGGLSGKQFLTAVTLGVDLICRMGRTNKIPSGLSGMNVTFQYACFGCAGVVGRILGLDEEKMVHAMGLAYSQTAGNPVLPGPGRSGRSLCSGFFPKGDHGGPGGSRRQVWLLSGLPAGRIRSPQSPGWIGREIRRGERNSEKVPLLHA